MEDHFVIGIDIGGTNYRIALADAQGNLINRNAEPTRSWESSEIGLDRIKETIRQTTSGIDFSRVKAITVSAGGPLDLRTGVLLTPPSLPAWRDVPIKTSLEEAFRIPVWVENDADLAALGEQRFGAGKGCDRLIYITVSTGIGGGIIHNGRILTGSTLSVAEIGHMVVDPNGPVCNCGGKGHLEPLASGTAIARIAGEKITQGETSTLSHLCEGDISVLTAEMVTEAARNGDSLANEVIQSAGKYLGMAIASLVHLFDPQVVIIGGGVSNAGGLILEPIRKSMDACLMADFVGRTRVVQSELGDNSGIMGAVAFALDKLKSN